MENLIVIAKIVKKNARRTCSNCIINFKGILEIQNIILDVLIIRQSCR